MVYHGQPRILTEIASVELADPFVNPAGKDVPLGPQEVRWNYPVPYKSGEWRLRQIVDYAVTATFAGIGHVAKNRVTWLENFYRVHADWVNRKAAPYAFVLPAGPARSVRRPTSCSNILRIGEVEIHQAKAPFTAGGRQYGAGSWVIKLAQPYGAFAKTMLERQQYPDLRLFPGGPPKPPYDVTGHTLGLLMGVEVDQIEPALRGEPRSGADASPDADADACATEVGVPRRARVERRLHRRGAAAGGRHRHLPCGPGIRERRPHLRAGNLDRSAVARGDAHPGRRVHVHGPARRVRRQGLCRSTRYRLKPSTRIGLWRGANNMPGGWMKWLLEQYGFNHRTIASTDFTGDLAAQYDAIVLPDGTSRATIVTGLDPKRHDKEWTWAYGVGDAGWKKLGDWVRGGGTLVAIGSAVETARALLDLPIERTLPAASGGRRGGGPGSARAARAATRLA